MWHARLTCEIPGVTTVTTVHLQYFTVTSGVTTVATVHLQYVYSCCYRKS
jgi:hypothetical protein